MYTLCFYNRKGGVGKTSIAGAVAVELVIKGKKVLMIDTDSQGNLSSQFMNGKEISLELADYLKDSSMSLDKVVTKTAYDNLYIIPTKSRNGKLDDWVKHEADQTENHDVFNYLVEDAKKLGFDFVVYDMPPSFTELDKKVLLSADEVIPVLQIAKSSIDGLVTYYNNLRLIRGRGQKPLSNKLVFNQQDKRKAVQKALIPTIEEETESKNYFMPNDEAFKKAELKSCALQEMTIKPETQEVLNQIVNDLLGGNN